MIKVAVISGVTGMTGNELARQLLKKQYVVVGFDNFFASSINCVEDLISDKDFHFFKYDLNSKQDLNQLNEYLKSEFEGAEFHFVNCAAVVHTKHFYEVEDTFETNVLGMKVFLDMSIEIGALSYVNCSTSEVYSMQSYKEGGVQESDSVLLATAEHSQRTSYAAGKLLTEFFLKDAVDKSKIKGCSIRFANVYSDTELHAEHIIPYIIQKLRKSKTICLLNNSKVNKRTFLHNIDSCSSVISLLENVSALDGTVYNSGTSEEIGIVDLVKLIAKKMNIHDLSIEFDGYRESDPERRLLNVDKLQNNTGWSPIISLSKGLDSCIEREASND